MSACTVNTAPHAALDWLRVGGLSGTLSVHLLALILLAIPIAVPSLNPVQPDLRALTTTLIEAALLGATAHVVVEGDWFGPVHWARAGAGSGTMEGAELFAAAIGPDDPDDMGFFDRFTFTQGRQISRAGDETIEAEFSMTDRFFLRVERDRYDNFNAGVVWRWRFR